MNSTLASNFGITTKKKAFREVKSIVLRNSTISALHAEFSSQSKPLE